MRAATWPSVPATVDAHVIDGVVVVVVVVEARLEAVTEADSAGAAVVAAARAAVALPVALDEPHAARPAARSTLAHADRCRPGLMRRTRRGRERLMRQPIVEPPGRPRAGGARPPRSAKGSVLWRSSPGWARYFFLLDFLPFVLPLLFPLPFFLGLTVGLGLKRS